MQSEELVTTTEYGTAGRVRRRGLLLAALVLLLLVGAVCLVAHLRSPRVAVKLAVGGAFAELAERPELTALSFYREDSSLSFRLADDSEKPLFGGFEMGGDLYHASDAFLARNLTLRLGQACLEGELYGDGKRLYLTERNLLGGGYLLRRGQAVSAFENSILAHGSGSTYAMSAEAHRSTVSLLRQVDAYATEAVRKEAMEHLTRYVRLLLESMDDHASFGETAADAEVWEQIPGARVLSVTLDADSIDAILTELAEALRGDRALCAFLEEHGASFYLALSPLLSEVEEGSLCEMLSARIDQLRQNVREKLDRPVTVSFYTTGFFSRLTRLDCAVGEDEVFSLELGREGVAETREVTLTLDGGAEVWRYALLACEDGRFECRLDRKTANLLGFPDNRRMLGLLLDGREERFSVQIGDGLLSISGVYQKEGNRHILTSERVRIEGLASKNLIFTATLGQEPMPTPAADDSLRTVDALTEAEAEAILARRKETEDGLPAVVALFLGLLI